MIYNSKNITYLIIFLLFLFISSTNSYFNYYDSLSFGGADGYSYFEISKSSPGISEIALQPIHAERFIIPYLLGFISKISFIEIYSLYRLLVFILIIVINYYFIELIRKFNIETNYTIFSILLLNLNPYITRFYIANPLIINDLFFILGFILCAKSFTNNNKKYFYIGLIISAVARQSALALIISILFLKVLRKNNFFLKNRDIFFSIILFIIIYFIGYSYSSAIPQTDSRYDQYFITIFGIFIENVELIDLLIYLIWPLLSFGPFIIFIIFFCNIETINFKKNLEFNIFIIICSTMIISQAVLQGLEVGGKNIIRLTTLAYVPLLILFILNINKNKKTNILKKIMFLALLFIWSSHPTFSVFSFLEGFKF